MPVARRIEFKAAYASWKINPTKARLLMSLMIALMVAVLMLFLCCLHSQLIMQCLAAIEGERMRERKHAARYEAPGKHVVRPPHTPPRTMHTTTQLVCVLLHHHAHCKQSRQAGLASRVNRSPPQVYNGHMYATAHVHTADDKTIALDGAEPAELAAGWEVAPAQHDSYKVCYEHHWQCAWLVLANGDIHATGSNSRGTTGGWGYPPQLSRLVRNGSGSVSVKMGERGVGPPYAHEGADVLLRKRA